MTIPADPVDQLVERVISKIVDHIQPVKVFLFGSRVRGDASEDSDIDLVVIYDGPKSKRDVEVEIHRLFKPHDFSMDVFVMTPQHFERFKRIANTLAREIAENGLVVYG